jgi:hypothetical protein
MSRFRYYVYSCSLTLVIGTCLTLNRQRWHCTVVGAIQLLGKHLYRILKLHEQATFIRNHISENFCANFEILASVLATSTTVMWNLYSAMYRQ